MMLLLSCKKRDNDSNLFNNLVHKDAVQIYLNAYHLDSVPKEVGRLTGVKRLYIAMDSGTGWTVYPPLSAMDQRIKTPPFKHLPNEITTLVTLERLALIGLDLVALPDNFDKLENLDSLSLFMNKLTISDEIQKLKKLKKLKYIALFGNNVDSIDVQELKKAIPGIFVE
jgi:Leucine-rich repeat (LRR) protein